MNGNENFGNKKREVLTSLDFIVRRDYLAALFTGNLAEGLLKDIARALACKAFGFAFTFALAAAFFGAAAFFADFFAGFAVFSDLIDSLRYSFAIFSNFTVPVRTRCEAALLPPSAFSKS